MRIQGQSGSISRTVIAAIYCLLLMFFEHCPDAMAQQAEAASAPASSSGQSQSSGGAQPDKSHVFGFMPNYLTVEDPNAHPPALTANQKFKYMALNTFDPFEFGIVAVVAGIGQARNDPKSWGQGWDAYGKRYAASFADQADWNFWVEAALPAALKYDPRYYRMGQGGVARRTGYAISRIFVIRTDRGSDTFNVPEIFGAGISSGISNAYYPSEDRTLKKNLTRWGFLLGEDTVLNILKEFWPDIRHHLGGH